MNGEEKAGAGEINLRTVAQLFKHDLASMINASQMRRSARAGLPHASAILAGPSSYCLRAQVLAAIYPDLIEHPAQEDWQSRRNAIYLHGWTLHKKYQDLLLRFGRVMYFNEDFDKPELDYTHYDENHLLYFSPDAIVEHCGYPMVVEIKGYNNDACTKLDEHGPPPIDAHRQVNLYLHLLGLRYGLILVENKNTQALLVWCVAYSEEMAEPYLTRIQAFKDAYVQAKRGEGLPKRVCPSASDSQARNCNSCRACFQK